MRALFFKEIKAFLNTFTGALVIAIFLLINSAFLWIFPGDLNLLDSGWANLDGLFILSPWVFMFLLPAITMRMFSDEKRFGTLELLYTKPINEWSIVSAKFLAAWVLVLLSLLPTLLYFYTLYELGAPKGSLDIGGTWGSFIGLFLLGGTYASIGLFASSLTENPIVSLLLGAGICFLMFYGIDQMAQSAILGQLGSTLSSLGISEHYTGLSRGVIDLRDVLYFLSVGLIFLSATRLKLQSRNW